MARQIHSRLKISGQLLAETPLHVGGIGGNTDSDMALAVNGKGELYVPGTSITGVLRAWCEKNFGENEIGEIFGPKREKGVDAGHASFVLIEDATIENAKDVLTEIRDGVGIDRFYGTAADKSKFDREILPKGTILDFKMTVEIGENLNANQTKAIFSHLLEALHNGKLRFGGSRTRGLGKLKLTETSFKEQNLKGFANILKVLKKEADDVVITDEIKQSIAFEANPHLDITIDWSPVQPVMVKAGFEGFGVDMLPLTSQTVNGKVALVLPGSSIKGALRSHAERIMRTVLGNHKTKGKEFHEQIKNIPLIDEMFGAKAEKNGNGKKGLGALAIDDCFAENTFDADDWNAVTIGKTKENNEDLSYERQELWKALRKLDGADVNVIEQVKKDTETFKVNHHNAIDRFTGGAADSALYSVLAPTKIAWEKMQFSLDLSRPENPKQCLMLLLLVLRNLSENRLPLGFATNRGMGEIKVKSIKLEGKNLEGFENEMILDEGKMSELDKTFRENLNEEWKEWLKQQNSLTQ